MSRILRSDCRCCSGTGIVEAYTGDMRPCSRCRVDDFHAWYTALLAERRAPKSAEEASS